MTNRDLMRAKRDRKYRIEQGKKHNLKRKRMGKKNVPTPKMDKKSHRDWKKSVRGLFRDHQVKV